MAKALAFCNQLEIALLCAGLVKARFESVAGQFEKQGGCQLYFSRGGQYTLAQIGLAFYSGQASAVGILAQTAQASLFAQSAQEPQQTFRHGCQLSPEQRNFLEFFTGIHGFEQGARAKKRRITDLGQLVHDPQLIAALARRIDESVGVLKPGTRGQPRQT